MTDLAQQAFGVAAVARRRAADALSARPTPWLCLGGFAASALTVVAGGRIGVPKSVIPLTRWFGLLSVNGVARHDYGPGALMLLGIVALVLVWLAAVRVNRPERCSERQVWAIAAAWALPFVLGPPLLSNDVYTYAAQGVMQRHGLDVYTHGPSALGGVPAVAAVDPNWRTAHSPYGPLGSTIQHLAVAVSGGSPLGAVIVLRGLAVVCAVAIGLLAAELAGPRRVQALTLTVLNPLLLLQVVSAAHLEGIMCALLLGALVAANDRRWALALVLGCAAAAVKVPALLAVLAVIAVHAAGRPPAAAARTIGRDALITAVAATGFTLLVPNGLGWIKNLQTPALGHTPFAPASVLGDIFAPIVPSASFDDLSTGGRITAMVAAGCAVVYLLATANRRALNRTVGYGLLALGLLSPVLYPWYLLWGIVCLAPTARAARRDWLLLASALGCVLTPAGFTKLTTDVLTVVAILVSLAIIAPRVLDRYRAAKASLGTAA